MIGLRTVTNPLYGNQSSHVQIRRSLKYAVLRQVWDLLENACPLAPSWNPHISGGHVMRIALFRLGFLGKILALREFGFCTFAQDG
jgi:hypothetical protein